LPGLRNDGPRQLVEECLREAKERNGLRIVQYCIQEHHLHLIVEVSGTASLSRGMQGLTSAEVPVAPPRSWLITTGRRSGGCPTSTRCLAHPSRSYTSG